VFPWHYPGLAPFLEMGNILVLEEAGEAIPKNLVFLFEWDGSLHVVLLFPNTLNYIILLGCSYVLGIEVPEQM
jgi:hypothetical protein